MWEEKKFSHVILLLKVKYFVLFVFFIIIISIVHDYIIFPIKNGMHTRVGSS